jgi:hypothetical protein
VVASGLMLGVVLELALGVVVVGLEVVMGLVSGLVRETVLGLVRLGEDWLWKRGEEKLKGQVWDQNWGAVWKLESVQQWVQT